MKGILAMFVLATVLMSCTSTGGANFSNVIEKEWKLIEVRIESGLRKEVIFDRNTLDNESAENFFTLAFNEERLSGAAAPNRYTAPYTLGEKDSISIKPMASTMMASLFEPESLREHVYYSYMHNVYKWDLDDENLILYSKTEDGLDIRMTFAN